MQVLFLIFFKKVYGNVKQQTESPEYMGNTCPKEKKNSLKHGW